MNDAQLQLTSLSTGNKRLVAVLVFAAFAFALGSAWVLGVRDPSGLLMDDHLYYSLAQSIVHRHCFGIDGAVATYWPPAYPMLLALIALVAGPGLWPIYFVQSVLYASALYLVFRIALALTDDARLATVTLALCVFWAPFYIQMTSEVMSENLALPLGVLAFWTLIRAQRAKATSLWVLTGVLFALAGLARPMVLVAGLAAAACIALRPRPTRPNVIASLTIVFAAFVTLLPWMIRGYIVTDGFVPISAQGPYLFYLGNSPEYYATGDDQAHWFDHHRYTKDMQTPSREVNTVLMHEGMKRIEENPPRAAGYLVRKFMRLWLGDLGRPPKTSRFGSDRTVGGFVVPKQALICTPAFLLALLGWFTLRKNARLRPLMWGLVVYTLAHMFVYAEMRHSFPMCPYLLMFTAAGLLTLVGKGPIANPDIKAP